MQLQAYLAENGISIMYVLVALPALIGLLLAIMSRMRYALCSLVFLLGVAANLFFAIMVFGVGDVSLYLPWAGYDFGINFVIRLYGFSRLMIVFSAGIAALIAIYAISFLRRKKYFSGFFFFYMLIIAMVNGVFLSDNLAVMLFFWEGLLVSVFAMVLIGNKNDGRFAVKALVMNGLTDLALMLGIVATALAAGTTVMSDITALPLEGLGTLGFICMTIGALGKAGAIPFHSWIPDAAKDAPLPFMALMPGAFDKILGIYLLYRITFDFYDFQPGSPMSVFIMVMGVATIFLAAAMAMAQKDIKRMLSFHAVSQVGYMILGIGTGLTVGFVAAIFHMVNNALYKSCLFLGAGAVEHRTGTTDLNKIGGLGKVMPLTAIAFIIAAMSIAGVPPFNGFFSKELIFDAALETGMVWYILAVAGAFMTAASFLKTCHGAFFGPLRLPQGLRREELRDAPGGMLVPIWLLAALCAVFGIVNQLPLGYIQPLLGEATAGISYAGWPHSTKLVLVSVGMLLLAIGNHIIGFTTTGEGGKALDHIHYAPVLRQLYDGAERHYLDPYNIFMVLTRVYAWLCFMVDRGLDWVFNSFFVGIINFCTTSLRSFSNGDPSRYASWSFAGLGFLALLFILLA